MSERRVAGPPIFRGLASLLVLLCGGGTAVGQLPGSQVGEAVPRDVREMYERGLDYLAGQQDDRGAFPGGNNGPGVTGMAVMAMLASGEDPNFGVYSGNIRRGLRSMIENQNGETGVFSGGMYHHGFATLCLAEAYGTVDDRNLWPAGTPNPRSIGESLELAVRAAVTSQKQNQFGAWRYSADSNDADTSVSGAVLVSLLAARNAGVEVPDESIDKAISYFRSMTSDNGQVAYAGGFGGFDESLARISIATLVYAVARRRDLTEYRATLTYLTDKLEADPPSYREYTRYYQAQALFQGDVEAWRNWNRLLVRELKSIQQADGHFDGQFGPTVDTSLSLLALALNFRFLPIYER